MKQLSLALAIGVVLSPTPAAAQLVWQLQPYCNRVDLTLIPQTGGYSFIGSEDQCGNGAQSSVTGTAEQQGASYLVRLHVVAAGQKDIHVTALVSPPSYSGTWSDSGGLSGTFAFGANTGGPVRPTPALPQLRVGAVCAPDSAIRAINADGTVVCETDDLGSVQPGGITTALIGDGAVTSAKVADGAITSANIADSAISTTKIADGTITQGKLAASVFAGSGAATSAARSDHTHAAAGANNTSVGAESLFSTTSGFDNTAVGWRSMRATTGGNRSTALGTLALSNQTTGNDNTAVGISSLQSNLNGFANTGVGGYSLWHAASGGRNTALGYRAGEVLTTGSDNVYIHAVAGSGSESNTIRIGSSVPSGFPAFNRAFIGGIRGSTTGINDAVAVVIDSNGQLGTMSSSRRGKDNIEDLGPISSRLLDLRPVRFTYTQPFADGSKPTQYGLIAEEVEQVLPNLVAYNQDGDVETVKYHVLPTLLLAEVQRLEKQRAAQAEEIAALRATVERLERVLLTSPPPHQ